ncbi:MAG: DUF3791 domain-containing protein [Prevotellaceae bacterium]|nr:DUF3791 domain-containing protein [Prevotellaceae bacterium]
MRDNVLWRKIARIVVLIAKELNVSEEHALTIFYGSRTYQMLKDPRYGLQVMSDAYVLDEYLNEIAEREQLPFSVK